MEEVAGLGNVVSARWPWMLLQKVPGVINPLGLWFVVGLGGFVCFSSVELK